MYEKFLIISAALCAGVCTAFGLNIEDEFAPANLMLGGALFVLMIIMILIGGKKNA